MRRHLLGRDNASLWIIFPFHPPKELGNQRDQVRSRCQAGGTLMSPDGAGCSCRNRLRLCQAAQADAAARRTAFSEHESEGVLHAWGQTGGFRSAKLTGNGMGHSGGQEEPNGASPPALALANSGYGKLLPESHPGFCWESSSWSGPKPGWEASNTDDQGCRV